MNKKEALNALLSRGYVAHDTDGILYIDSSQADRSAASELRNVMNELGYNNSWGIKKVSINTASEPEYVPTSA